MSPATFAEPSYEFKDEDFNWLRQRASEHSGIVLPDSKRGMVYSRLTRRLRALGLKDFAAYRRRLSQGDPREFGEFINALTTNLTAFFREGHHFAHLRDVALPDLLERRGAGSSIELWSAGCSTGEEPYSLAMTIEEANRSKPFPYGIRATDLDTRVLAHARAGIYADDRLESIPPALRKRYLWRGAGGFEGQFRVREELGAHLQFAQLNLIENWRHPAPLHVIFCRNVVIYFDKPVKQRLFDRFADQLVPGGYLYIGHAETLFQISDRFEACGQTAYRRIV